MVLFFWTVLRNIDSAGSGWAEIDLEAIATFLEISKQTIRRYIRNGLNAGIFRGKVKVSKGIFRIYYAAKDVLLEKYGMDSLTGAIATVPSEQFKARNCKLLVAQAIAQYLQDCSRRMEKRRLHKERKSSDRLETLVDDATSLQCRLGEQSSDNAGKGILGWGSQGRRVFVSARCDVFGVSLQTIASHLGRSLRTVQNRLSNANRLSKGLTELPRVQVFKELDDESLKAIAKHLHLYGDLAAKHFDGGMRLNKDTFLVKQGAIVILMFKGKAYKVCTNLYAEMLELKKAKCDRYFTAKRLKRKKSLQSAENIAHTLPDLSFFEGREPMPA